MITRGSRYFAATLAALLLGACAPLTPPGTRAVTGASTAAAAPAGPVIAPNANLIVQGIPPVPASIADDVARYNDFRGHRFVDWHPTKREMLVSYRQAGASTAQIFRLASPLAEPEALTDSDERIIGATYEPIDGRYIVIARGRGGDEAAQLYRVDLATHQTTQITEPDERHDLQRWLHRSSALLYLSLPLDRTASAGKRENIRQRLTLVDPLRPEQRRRLAELPGGGWEVGGVAWSDGQIALTRYLSATESQVWLLDMASGALKQVLPAAGQPAATHLAQIWKKDDSGFFVLGDRSGEFRELMFYRLADARLVRISRAIPWNIESVSLDASGRLLAVRANVEGRSELRFFDADSFDELPSPDVADGSVVQASFHPRLPLLAVTFVGSTSPSTIGVLDPANGALRRWTAPSSPPGIDPRTFGRQEIVRWKSFDRREISGLLTSPPARFTGPRPVLVSIHGGPEEQARFGFLGRNQYFVEELGIAILQPNVRGSAGFGKTFLSLDDGMKREDSVKDIGALFDWIARQPGLDASRVMVIGGSYGGYMSLAVATRYSDRIAGSIDIVGISNFVSFLENTESYRRDLRRVEYGDERDPAMREFMLRTAPLHNAEKITKPLFVVQGRNDPRVPYTEAEQIVARVRQSGTPVWYLRAENEGHGFAHKENADFQFYVQVMFMRQTLLGDRVSGR